MKYTYPLRGELRAALLCLLIATYGSCTEDFSEINTNPNAPVDVQPSLLLRQVIYSYADGMSYEGFTGGANLGQYFSADPGFNAFDRGDLLAPQFGGNPWPLLYTNLRDIEIVLAKSREVPTLAVYEGPALVLRSLIAGTLTDLFGDVPYREAAAGLDGNVSPAYDEQASIYTGAGGLLESLAEASDNMQAYRGTTPLEGDELYGGDLQAWMRLANTLRLRYAMRASDELSAEAVAAIVKEVSDAGLITTSAQDGAFAFGSAPNDFRFARARLGDFTNYLMSETIDSTLDALGDPREALWFREAANGGFNGIRNGVPADFAYDGGDISLPGLIWREDASALAFPFATAWETHFLLAEAAARGLTDGNAQELYETGVQLAFDYWKVELPADYLSRPGVAYEGLQQIGTQRWLASIGAGYEGWIGWRRTGYPAFLAPLASLNEGLIPIRFPYPADEQALNAEAYATALSRIGGENSVNVAVWWDE